VGSNSVEYAIFLPVVVLVYFLTPRRGRVAVLLAASYVFYAAWSPRYLALIVVLIAVNDGFGLFSSQWPAADGRGAGWPSQSA
jgi:D-alanyl-lipoteichoic acid acyltransferase DltB (MBOAT superfamily)